MHGLCKEGSNCRYSHDLASSQPAAMICKFFQKGNCVFAEPSKGERPPAVHKEPEKEGGDHDRDDKKHLRKQMCPYAAAGECRYGVNCAYLHGDVCDMCGLQVLHPTDNAQRLDHTKACIEAHEKDMEISFAIQRSKDMMCGVCMEVVFEKANPSERRFGILSNCSHCYCLKCIRKWRSAKQFESKIIKSCPECRITSNFVIPSEYWRVDTSTRAAGPCPFGSNCFYKHAFPDGRLEEAQPLRRTGGSNGAAIRREGSDLPDHDDEEMVTFELSEMLLMLLAAGAEDDDDDDDVTDSEDEWDLFHEELDDIYEIYL
ncbi:hypothetical protein CRUP_025846 [Coryphaenoides rupestris]|nr:hypothetical protein CRUP_025846 [Coryphaenoides rupestris]